MVAATAVPAFFARVGPELNHAKRSRRCRVRMPVSARSNEGIDMGYRDASIWAFLRQSV